MSPPNRRQTAAAEARIHRLKTAIGPGPHSRHFKPNRHLHRILTVIGDQAAVEILEAEKSVV